MNEIKVPTSPGELLDKLTILRIKSRRIEDQAKLRNVRLELDALQKTWADSPYAGSAAADANFDAEVDELTAVNERLWDIEDAIRDKERNQAFDADFIRLARAVYVENDVRAAIKRRINVSLGSVIVEEKSYTSYRAIDPAE